MAENFGKQFTIAREALGLSTKDVATKIKIRQEYIENIENGIFDLPLPNIYIRGFIRNYAKLLKLDVDSVMSQCPVQAFHVNEAVKYHASDVVNFIKDDYESVEESVRPNKTEEKVKSLSSFVNSVKNKFSSITKRSFILWISGFIIFVLVIIGILLFRSDRDSFDISGILPVEAEMIPTKSIVLSATGNVKVVVRNKDTLEKIYSGGLISGTVKTIAYYKPVQVFYDHGEYLLIQQDNGEKVYPQPGRGGVEIK